MFTPVINVLASKFSVVFFVSTTTGVITSNLVSYSTIYEVVCGVTITLLIVPFHLAFPFALFAPA